jgi:cytoskeletal protein CcmA (bactofilin family)
MQMAEKRKTAHEATFVIDPVRMNIVNKIAAGTKSSGALDCSGGMVLQGFHRGELIVRDGPLVLWEGSKLIGRTIVYGDAYVFGSLGDASEQQGSITVMGTLFLTAKAVVFGRMRYRKLSTYDGAQIHGTLETLTDDPEKKASQEAS